MELNVRKALREGRIRTGFGPITSLGFGLAFGGLAWTTGNMGFNNGIAKAKQSISKIYDDGAISETIKDGMIVSLPTPRDTGLPLYLTIGCFALGTVGRFSDIKGQRRYEQEPSAPKDLLSHPIK